MIVGTAANYSQAYTLLSQLGSDDVTILATGRVTIPSVSYDVDWSGSGKILQLLGVTGEAELDLSQVVWNGSDYTQTLNGFSVGIRGVVMAGMTIRDFQANGDGVKFSPTEFACIFGNQWRDCGSTLHPYKPGVPVESVAIGDSIHNQCLGIHVSGSSAQVTVVANRFRHCALSEALWSHCVYVAAKRVFAMGNSFDGCGNPFSIYPGVSGETGLAFGNSITNPALCQRPTGLVRPCVFSGQTYELDSYYNVIRGLISDYAESVTSGRFRSDFNQFAELNFNGYHNGGSPVPGNFASISGAYKTFAQWQALGLDTHSTGTPANVTLS